MTIQILRMLFLVILEKCFIYNDYTFIERNLIKDNTNIFSVR